MARFSLRPKMRSTQANQDVISIPEPVDDNQYLAASAQAAIADKTSGAYDQYMFTDSELRQMPYETAVDTHLQLVSTRLKQRYGRALTAKRNQVLRRQGRLQKAELKASAAAKAQGRAEGQVERQLEILAGDKSGRHGLIWEGSPPDFLGPWHARMRLGLKPLVFALVGAVDIYIIWRSLISIGLEVVEAGFFTAPAVALQLAFPHLAGVRLAKLYRGATKKIVLIGEICVLLAVWGVFVYTMSTIRVGFIQRLLSEEGERMSEALNALLLAFNLVILVALGGWLIFLAIRENPHEHDALACRLEVNRCEKRLFRAERRVTKREVELGLAESNLQFLEKELEDSLAASRLELSEAAKAIYRRALVNQVGSVDFTAAYLGKEKSDDN